MTTSRISTSQIFENAQKHITEARKKEVQSTTKSATQKNINKPSEDPSGWLYITSQKDSKSVIDSHIKNALMAKEILHTTENIFTNVGEAIGRIYELSIGAADDLRSNSETRRMILSEVKELFGTIIQTLNFRFGNRVLLSGYRSSDIAFDESGSFHGDNGVIEIEIDRGSKIPINIDAEKAICGKGSLDGVNVIEVIKNFMTGLSLNDTELIRDNLEGLKKSIDQISMIRSEIGGRLQKIDATLNRHSESKTRIDETISKIEDVDVIKVFSDLTRDENILHAAISTSQKILSKETTNKLFE